MSGPRPSLNVLSLFAGIGGLELGLERAGMTTVGQVEKNPFAQRVLAKHWPEVPRHDDVTTAIDWWFSEPRPPVDLICGGFPCQDISNAGHRQGIGGERSGLWSYMADTVRALRPSYVLMENVSAILVRGLDVVAADLATLGYDLEWDCIPASSVGAPHQRDRWIGVAYPASSRWNERRDDDGQAPPRIWGVRQPAGGSRRPADHRAWPAEPGVGRVADGVPDRVDRLKALGNAVVPAVAEHIGRLIVAAETSAEVAA